MSRAPSPPPPATAAPAPGAASPPSATAARPSKKVASRAILRRRRTRGRPEHGWGLIGRAAERLGLAGALNERLACRAFAVALHRLLPRLEPQARAEQLQAGTLHIRVSSSAVASELSYVKDVLSEQVNAQLALLASEGTPRATRRRSSKSAPIVERLAWRVGPIKSLPSYADWQAWTPRAEPPPLRRPAWDLGVASEVAHVSDQELRNALQALYGAATQGPAPTGTGSRRPPR